MFEVTVRSKRGIEIVVLFGVKDIALAIANQFSRIDKAVEILSVNKVS